MQDEDGYPPVAVESVWGRAGKRERQYIIDNIPFFTCDATLEDIVLTREEEGHYGFEKLLRPSGNSLIRVLLFDKSRVSVVVKELEALDCSTEYDQVHGLLAVNIPENVQFADVQAYLQRESSLGRIDYEEAILRH